MLAHGMVAAVIGAKPTNDSATSDRSTELFERLLGASIVIEAMQSVRGTLPRSPHFCPP